MFKFPHCVVINIFAPLPNIIPTKCLGGTYRNNQKCYFTLSSLSLFNSVVSDKNTTLDYISNDSQNFGLYLNNLKIGIF